MYISRWHHGSPADRYGVYACHWITHVNGKPTPDLDVFLDIVKREVTHGKFARLRICALNGKRKQVAVKADLRYWPTAESRLDHTSGLWINSLHQRVVDDE